MRLVALTLVALLIVSGADAPTGGLDPLSLLRDYGLPITVVVLLVFEILVPKGRLADALKQREEAIAIGRSQTEATKVQAEATKGLSATVEKQGDSINRLATAVEKLVEKN